MQRTSNRDKKRFKFALFFGNGTQYKTDKENNPIIDYTMSDGTNIYKESGEPKPVFANPVDFRSSISESGGQADLTEYGLSISDYSATLVFPKGAYPIKEGALVWKDSNVEFQYNVNMRIETDMGIITTRCPKETSADYKVVKVSDSINLTRVVLAKVNK